MESLDIDQYAAEIFPRGDLETQAVVDHRPERPLRNAPPSSKKEDGATAALEMVSEAAAAIRLLEEQSAQAVGRAHDLANSIVKKLEISDARAARAEAEAAQTGAELTQTRDELSATQQRLALTENELAETQEQLRLTVERAEAAEQRVVEANAAIERIVDAIRTQLPSRGELAAVK